MTKKQKSITLKGPAARAFVNAAAKHSGTPPLVREGPEWKDDYDGRGSEALFENFRVVVHHFLHYPPEQWLLSIYGVREKIELKAKTLDEAKAEALRWFRDMLKKSLEDADELLKSSPKPTRVEG